MARVAIEPRCRAALEGCGLRQARDFLAWPGVILSGHPRRHVLRVRVGDASFILKKEHLVPWSDRLASAWAGFGWVSKSLREAAVLGRLRAAGVPCPEVVAAGEDGRRAFLLVREQPGMTELRDCLARPDLDRRALAAALGRELARVHAAGFEQPDLYAKHILVEQTPAGWRFCLIDWQRSRQRPAVPWSRRLRDLAALDASLAAPLAEDRLRLLCLRAYLRHSPAGRPADLAGRIRRLAAQLLRRRKVRELRQPPLPDGAQQLLWLEEGERLCVARAFHDELDGRLPAWLPREPAPCADGACVEHRLIRLGPGRTARLVQRWRRPAAGWLGRGKFPAPEFAQAAAIFRLQRFGVAGPRLLAMGHRTLARGQRFSFLLTEPPAGVPLEAALRQAAPAERFALLRRLGAALRQMHEAGYTFRAGADGLGAWVVDDGRLALASVEGLEQTAGAWKGLAAMARQGAGAKRQAGIGRSPRERRVA